MDGIDTCNSAEKASRKSGFQKGNPGKPKGTRNRATQLVEKLLSKDINKVVEVVQAAAKGGDMQAVKLILDRLAPPPKGRLVAFDLPPINTAADAETAIGAVLAAVAGGKLTIDEGERLASMIARKAEITHMRQTEERLAALEAASKPKTITSYARVA
jgi:hypothetical protein